MAGNSGPRPKAPRGSKPARKTSKLTTAELATALEGKTTLPADKIEQAIASVHVDGQTVKLAFEKTITPDGQHHGSPQALRIHDAADAQAANRATLAPAATDNGDSRAQGACNLLAKVFGYWQQRTFTVRNFLNTCPTKEVELPTLEMSAASWHELADHLTDHVVITAIHAAHHVDEPNPFHVPTDWAGVVKRAQDKPDRYWPAIANALASIKLIEFEADKLERFIDLEWKAMDTAGKSHDAVRSLIRDGCRHAIYLLLSAQATEKMVGSQQAATDSDATAIGTTTPADLKGERFRRLHVRFLDGSQRYPYLRYIAATGHNNCPGWPHVPTWPSHDTLGLAHKDWLELTTKRPGTFFVGMNDHWLEIEGQLWHGSFYFDGPVPSQNDHDALQRQSAEIREEIEQFVLLANEAAGFLGNLPSVHPGIHFPRKPELAHRWLEAVCAAAPVEPAGYHCFDARRVPHIFLASAILLERLHTAADKPDASTRPLVPLNVNDCDLRPAIAAAEAFMAERRKADERGKFDENGAQHILGTARRHLAEALAPFNVPDGLTGDEATVGAIGALLSMAGDGRADSRVERIEAVIAFLRNATGQNQEVATAALAHLPHSLAELAAAITADAAGLQAMRETELEQGQARKAMDEAAEQAYHYGNIDARDFPAWERRIVAFVQTCKAAGHDAALAESIAHFAALANKAARYAADVVRQAVEHPGSGTAAAALGVAVRDGFIRDVREALEGICDRATQPRRKSAKIDKTGQSESHTQPTARQESEPPFIPLPAQKAILEALDGRALRTDDLASAAKLERRSLFDRKRTDGTVIPGYLKELIGRKLVSNHRRLGYYRPDRPPPELKKGDDTATH